MADSRSIAIRANFFVLGLARNWLRVALIVLTLYVSLPFLAPTLMKLGIEGPAKALYTAYSPFCHQLPFRSFFLFGEQPVYPRYNVPGDWTPFESYIQAGVDGSERYESLDLYGFDINQIMAGRSFYGNDTMGYKVTLCERDIFIYIALLFGGLIYSSPRVRRRLRPAPLWLYVILGLGPIGIDGFSQLLSYPPIELWPVRETTPIFRVVTGALFGLMTAWLGFPYIDESFRETRRVVEGKLYRAGLLKK